MQDATKRPISEWSETDWLTKLGMLAALLTACADDAADLAHACLDAFYDRFGCYPWQHPDPPSAWRWCCQKGRSLWVDGYRQAQSHPPLSWEALAEGVVLVEIAEQVHEDVDGEAFLALLPLRLRGVLELRLAGYSWEEAAQRLGVQASTLRGYLLAPAPGLPPAWGASAGVYGGVVNLGNGNFCLQVPLVDWANGVSFTLVFNSQVCRKRCYRRVRGGGWRGYGGRWRFCFGCGRAVFG